MNTLVEGLRQILGSPDFYQQGSVGILDYGAVFEYFVGAVILCITVSSVFKFLIKVVTK